MRVGTKTVFLVYFSKLFTFAPGRSPMQYTRHMNRRCVTRLFTRVIGCCGHMQYSNQRDNTRNKFSYYFHIQYIFYCNLYDDDMLFSNVQISTGIEKTSS